MPYSLRFESKKRANFVAWVWNREHSVWFVTTGMKGLPQNVLLNFRLEFPKKDLTIYLPSGISEFFCQMVSTLGKGTVMTSSNLQEHDVTKFVCHSQSNLCLYLCHITNKCRLIEGECDAGLSDFLPHFWSIMWPYHWPHLSHFGRKSNFRNPNLVCAFKAF